VAVLYVTCVVHIALTTAWVTPRSLGISFCSLLAVLGLYWVPLLPSWLVLGACWVLPCPLFELPWVPFGSSWASLGLSCVVLECCMALLGCLCASLGHCLASLFSTRSFPNPRSTQLSPVLVSLPRDPPPVFLSIRVIHASITHYTLCGCGPL